MARAPHDLALAPRENGLRRSLDALGDACVVVFAAWTVVAYVGMATGARASVLVATWAALCVPGGAALVLRRRPPRVGSRGEDDAPGRRAGGGAQTPSSRTWLAPLALASGAAAALLAVVSDVPWALVWLLALAAVAGAVAAGRLRAPEVEPAPARAGWWADAVAAATALGLAAVAVFIRNPSADDVYYVNRAVATAELDRIPVNDVIFTNEEVARSGGTGLPLDSYSALQGALAPLLDVHAASVAYLLVPPVVTFLATWALWRLVRAWAPRAALACFALGCVFWIWSAEATPPADYALASGNFFLTRIWQGKVAFVAWMVPTLYVLLTRWLERRDRSTGALLVLAVVASIGLTGSAAIAVPLILAAAVAAAAARRDWPRLPVLLGGIVLAAGAGLAATYAFPLTVPLGKVVTETEWYYHGVFGTGVACVVAGFAAWAAPWLARPGVPAALATAVALVALAVLAPGVIGGLHDLLGLNGSRALRRALWVVPLPAVAGLLAAVPTGWAVERARLGAGARRAAVAVPALVLAGVLVAFGRPLWSEEAGSEWTARPTWKTSPYSLAAARAILARYDGDGPVLTDRVVMQGIALSTATTKAVNPRTVYAVRTLEPPSRTRQRVTLTAFVRGGRAAPSPADTRAALAALEVDLVCVRPGKRGVLRELAALDGYAPAFSTQWHACFAARG